MSLLRNLRIVGALLLLMGIGQVASAQRTRDMVYLGEAHVDNARDHDTISVGRNEGRFRSLQLHVAGAPVEFRRVVVHYANGANEELQLRDRIPAGGQTRMIDLRGNDRAIRSVEFWYSPASWLSSWTGARPRVTLYGTEYDSDQGRPNPGQGSWEYLGQAQVNGRGDRDRIAIGRNEGRFHSLQLRVVGAPIEFQRVVVHYANGASEELQLRDRIPAGGQTRDIDLRGNDRAIRNVEFWYSPSSWRAGSQPRVYLYGR